MGAVKAAMQDQGLLGGDEDEGWGRLDGLMAVAERAMRGRTENSPTWPAICECGTGKLNTICDTCHGAVISQIDRDSQDFEQLRDHLEFAADNLRHAVGMRAFGDPIGAAFYAGIAYQKYHDQDIQALVHCLGVASGRIK